MSTKHVKNLSAKKNTVSIEKFAQKKRNKIPTSTKLPKQNSYFPVLWLNMILFFSHVDHLVPVKKKMSPDSDSTKHVHEKIKASYVMHYYIIFTLLHRRNVRLLLASAEKTNFLIMNESTGVSVSRIS